MTTKTKPFILSKQTMGILKNFASLNSNILIKPGNVIKTITPAKNGMAEATVSEDFPVEFGIWDLNKFLGVVSLFGTPNMCFEEKKVKITDGISNTITYFYSEPRLLTVPTKNVNIPRIDLVLTLQERVFSDLQKASSVMQLPDLSFHNEGSTIHAVISDNTDPTGNSYRTVVGSDYSGGAKFKLNFKMDNMKMIQGDYTVSFSKNVVGQFVHNTIPIKYWYAMDISSVFEE